jgi:hypothetical protein
VAGGTERSLKALLGLIVDRIVADRFNTLTFTAEKEYPTRGLGKEGFFVIVTRPDGKTDLQEVDDTEWHLLYVACTRARDHVLVSGVDPASEFLDDLLRA